MRTLGDPGLPLLPPRCLPHLVPRVEPSPCAGPWRSGFSSRRTVISQNCRQSTAEVIACVQLHQDQGGGRRDFVVAGKEAVIHTLAPSSEREKPTPSLGPGSKCSGRLETKKSLPMPTSKPDRPTAGRERFLLDSDKRRRNVVASTTLRSVGTDVASRFSRLSLLCHVKNVCPTFGARTTQQPFIIRMTKLHIWVRSAHSFYCAPFFSSSFLILNRPPPPPRPITRPEFPKMCVCPRKGPHCASRPLEEEELDLGEQMSPSLFRPLLLSL